MTDLSIETIMKAQADNEFTFLLRRPFIPASSKASLSSIVTGRAAKKSGMEIYENEDGVYTVLFDGDRDFRKQVADWFEQRPYMVLNVHNLPYNRYVTCTKADALLAKLTWGGSL